MAKNLIPSCCKVLTKSQLRSAAAWSRVNATATYATIAGGSSSNSTQTRGSTRQHVNYSQAAEAASFRQQSTDSQLPKRYGINLKFQQIIFLRFFGNFCNVSR